MILTKNPLTLKRLELAGLLAPDNLRSRRVAKKEEPADNDAESKEDQVSMAVLSKEEGEPYRLTCSPCYMELELKSGNRRNGTYYRRSGSWSRAA